MNIFGGISLESVLSAAMRMGTPLLLASLGGLFTARGGIINLALEGIMLMGAFSAYAGALLSKSLLIGSLLGMLGGISMAVVLGFLSIGARANQTVASVGINIFSLGLTSYLNKVFFSGKGFYKSPTFRQIDVPIVSKIPIIGKALFNQNFLFYIAIMLVPFVWYVIYRTPFGLALRATGEHPKAVDTLGGNATKIRYISVIILGCLAGLGGASLTIGLTGNFAENITAGKGYIALAALIFGKYTPLGALGATLIFGFSEALQLRMQTAGASIPHQFLTMFPYVLTLIALLFVKKTNAPAAMGIPYKRQG